MAKSSKYVAGGTVQAGGGLYIPRQADEELVVLCRTRAFVYILSSRQVGKSSLMIRTGEQLAREGIISVTVDITNLGTKVTAEQWYLGFLWEIAGQLQLKTNPADWWNARADLPMTQRLTLFFQEVVLVEVTAPVVIFVDEIDTTLSLSFTDDFYGAIRYVYNARAKVPEFQRLSFVLIGVAMPNDLINDPKRTPFNIGQRVELTDFEYAEAVPLADGLGLPTADSQQILTRVLGWTGGHPYLTLRVFQEILNEIENNGKAQWSPRDIDALVANTFLGSAQDKNLQFVRDRLTARSSDHEGVLTTYRDILLNQKKILDEERSPIKSQLKLAGVVRRENDALIVRNRIYRKAFDEQWVKEHIRVNWARRLTRVAAVIALTVLIANLPLGVYAWNRKGAAEEALAGEKAAVHRAEALAQSEAAARIEEKTQRERAEEALAGEKAAVRRAEALAKSEAAARIEETTQRVRAEEALAGEKAAVRRAEALAKSEGEARLLAEESAKLAKKAEVEARNATEAAEKLNDLLRARGVAFQAEALINSSPQLYSEPGTLLAAKSMQDYSTVQGDQALRLGISLLTRPASEPKDTARVPNPQPKAVAFSPDGRLLAMTSENAVEVWEINTQERMPDEVRPSSEKSVRRFAFSAPVNDVAFSPSGRFIATASADGETILWDMRTGRLIWKFNHNLSVNRVTFSGDERYIATGSDDATAAVLDVPTGRLLNTLSHGASINAVAFTRTGDAFVTAGNDGIAQVWSAGSGRKTVTIKVGSSINVVAFTSDGRLLATASEDGIVRLWLPSGQTNLQLPEGKKVNAMSFSPDGRFLATASVDGMVRMWEWSNQRKIAERALGNNVTDVVFSPNGQFLAVASSDKFVRVLDVTRGLRRARVEPDTVVLKHEAPVQGLAFSPNGQYVATAGANITSIWDLDTSQRRLLGGSSGHLETVNSVMFSIDGKLVVTAMQDGTAVVWDAKTGSWKATLMGHKGPVNSAAFSNDGELVVTAGADMTARIWNWTTETGRQQATVLPHQAGVNAAVFNPSGTMIATASGEQKENTIILWDVTGKKLGELREGHSESVKAMAFHPTKNWLVSVSLDRTVRLWDWTDLNQLRPVPLERPMKHDQAVNAVAFSPEGSYIATASNDRTARIWDSSNGREVARVRHGGSVNAVAFSGTHYDPGKPGKYLATGSFDTTVRFWLWRPPDLLADACSRLTRNLTYEEWEQYLENKDYKKVCEDLPDPPKPN